jgi:uncharacterized protein
MTLPQLSLLDTRVLGVLVEKQLTVPDTYPLTLNALVAGCNQKSSRDPIIEASEDEVTSAIDRLKSLSLVMESSGGRAMRYAHNVQRVLDVPTQALAILTVLMLRGPQTAGELRIHTERLHRFSDISAVEGFLHELAARASGALVVELPRQAGSREARWSHLLSGAPDLSAASQAVPAAERVAVGEMAALRATIEDLQSQLARMRADVDRLMQELGISK